MSASAPYRSASRHSTPTTRMRCTPPSRTSTILHSRTRSILRMAPPPHHTPSSVSATMRQSATRCLACSCSPRRTRAVKSIPTPWLWARCRQRTSQFQLRIWATASSPLARCQSVLFCTSRSPVHHPIRASTLCWCVRRRICVMELVEYRRGVGHCPNLGHSCVCRGHVLPGSHHRYPAAVSALH